MNEKRSAPNTQYSKQTSCRPATVFLGRSLLALFSPENIWLEQGMKPSEAAIPISQALESMGDCWNSLSSFLLPFVTLCSGGQPSAYPSERTPSFHLVVCHRPGVKRCVWNTGILHLAYVCARARTYTHTHARKHAHTRTHVHARAHVSASTKSRQGGWETERERVRKRVNILVDISVYTFYQ